MTLPELAFTRLLASGDGGGLDDCAIAVAGTASTRHIIPASARSPIAPPRWDESTLTSRCVQPYSVEATAGRHHTGRVPKNSSAVRVQPWSGRRIIRRKLGRDPTGSLTVSPLRTSSGRADTVVPTRTGIGVSRPEIVPAVYARPRLYLSKPPLTAGPSARPRALTRVLGSADDPAARGSVLVSTKDAEESPRKVQRRTASAEHSVSLLR